jgi:drug/metabolite transporter (DMT)-like permease
MAVGAVVLLLLTLVSGQAIALPDETGTWLAIAYMVVLGSGPVFVLYVVVVRRWSASRASYSFVLIPLVTVLLSAWIDDEPIGAGLVLGGLLVLAGVYVGALRPRQAG